MKHTYKHVNTVKSNKKQKKKKQRASVGYMPFVVACNNTIVDTSLLY